jgi:hypothetical protein
MECLQTFSEVFDEQRAIYTASINSHHITVFSEKCYVCVDAEGLIEFMENLQPVIGPGSPGNPRSEYQNCLLGDVTI